MKNSSTKRALLLSITSMIICISMLLGTTFAWFTDTASTGVNHIQAGNLDVELEYLDLATGEWQAVKSDEPLFENDALWEPGFTQVVYLRIRNAGSLALKYKFAMTVIGETPGTNVDGNEFRLSDYLRYGVAENAVTDKDSAFASREDAVNAVAPGEALGNYLQEKSLLEGETDYLALVVYMPETVGNEANYMAGTTPPSIDLGITLTATQVSHESDSYGDNYDADVELPQIFIVGSGEGSYLTLQEAVTEAKEGDTIMLAPGTYSLTQSLTLGRSVSIVGAGPDETVIDVSSLSSGYAFPLINNANLSIYNVTLKGNNNVNGLRASSQTHVEKLEFVNCVFEDFRFPIYLAERTVTGGGEEKDNKIDNLIIKDCTFNNNSSHVYLGRGVVYSALIEGNTFAGNSQIGIEFYDCWTTRRTGSITFKDNSFTNEYPIVLLTGGPVTISNTSITYPEMPGSLIKVVYVKAALEENEKVNVQNTFINGVMRDLDQIDLYPALPGEVIIHGYQVP
ncbi:MAG TPA: hypothetical protein GXZ29_02155 [Clostridiales bacterium]|nr:hypothetical protein [Clostridiales bacterium]